MAVKNNTYNIQEVGLAKALVRKGHFCDIIFWTDKAEETVDVPVDKLGTVHVFYRRGKTVLKNIPTAMNCLNSTTFCNHVNTTRYRRGYWQKDILKKQLSIMVRIIAPLIKDII